MVVGGGGTIGELGMDSREGLFILFSFFIPLLYFATYYSPLGGKGKFLVFFLLLFIHY